MQLTSVKLTRNALSFEVPAPSFERIVGNTDKAYSVGVAGQNFPGVPRYIYGVDTATMKRFRS